MTTDFRALCAELLRELEHATHSDYQQQLKNSVRAALAKSQPEPPTDDELDELFTEIDQSGESESWRAFARAVLARWGTQQ